MIVQMTADEYVRLKNIEEAARNLHWVLTDLTPQGEPRQVTLQTHNPYAWAIVAQASAELAACLDISDHLLLHGV